MKYILSPMLGIVLAISLVTFAVAEDNIYPQNQGTLLAPVQPQVPCNSNYELMVDNILALGPNTTFGQGCIECGQTCTLYGTPCCDPCTCKGKFPNTTCQQ